jgi:predicted metal-dependent enzyme (double-stranded beta helix superfamily)
MRNIAPLRGFVQDMTALIDRGVSEAQILSAGRDLLAGLVPHDDWLPATFADTGPAYRQFLLHCDPAERFSVVSFFWGPGQATPVHDHTVWGLVRMLRGTEISTPMQPDPSGGTVLEGRIDRLRAGQLVAVSPNIHDIHRVSNALTDRPSISIHVYGDNIGRVSRHVFDPAISVRSTFVSGYSASVVPNLWG